MKKIIKIDGMMCGHCEAHVKKALESLNNVSVESVSHETNEAVVRLSSDVSDEVLKAAVEEAGYKPVSVEKCRG